MLKMMSQAEFDDIVQLLTKKVKPGDEWNIDLSQALKRYQEYAIRSDFGSAGVDSLGNDVSPAPLQGSFVEAGLILENACAIYSMRVENAYETIQNCAQSLRKSLLDSGNEDIQGEMSTELSLLDQPCASTSNYAVLQNMSVSKLKVRNKTHSGKQSSFSDLLAHSMDVVPIKIDARKRQLAYANFIFRPLSAPILLPLYTKDSIITLHLSNEAFTNLADTVSTFPFHRLCNERLLQRLPGKRTERLVEAIELPSIENNNPRRSFGSDSGFESSMNSVLGTLNGPQTALATALNIPNNALANITARNKILMNTVTAKIQTEPIMKENNVINGNRSSNGTEIALKIRNPLLSKELTVSLTRVLPAVVDSFKIPYPKNMNDLHNIKNVLKIPLSILQRQSDFTIPVGFLQLSVDQFPRRRAFSLPSCYLKQTSKRSLVESKPESSPKKIFKTNKIVELSSGQTSVIQPYVSTSNAEDITPKTQQPKVLEIAQNLPCQADLKASNIPTAMEIHKQGETQQSKRNVLLENTQNQHKTESKGTSNIVEGNKPPLPQKSSVHDAMQEALRFLKLTDNESRNKGASGNNPNAPLIALSGLQRNVGLINPDVLSSGRSIEGSYESFERHFMGETSSRVFSTSSQHDSFFSSISTPRSFGAESSIFTDIPDSASTAMLPSSERMSTNTNTRCPSNKRYTNNLMELYDYEDPDMDRRVREFHMKVKPKLEALDKDVFIIDTYKEYIMKFLEKSKTNECTMQDLLNKYPKSGENGRFVLASMHLTNEKKIEVSQDQTSNGDPKTIHLKLCNSKPIKVGRKRSRNETGASSSRADLARNSKS